MSTLRQYVSQIRSSFKWLSSDNLISDRAIADELRSNAIKLIKRATDQRKLFGSDNIFTEISCLKLKQVSIAECCDFTSPCNIARSIEKIPKIAENNYGILVQGVYSIDGKSRFNYIDPDRFANLLRIYPNKKNNHIYFWKKNDYLYISNPDIEMIKLIAYFEEDVDLTKLNCGEEISCPDNPLDLTFKCPGYLLPDVLKITRDTLRETYKNSIQDNTENDLDESK